jgi:hypothetical protein
MDTLHEEILSKEEEAKQRNRRLMSFVIFLLMLLTFLGLLYNVIFDSGTSTNKPFGTDTDNHPPLVAKAAPTPTLPPVNSGIHRRSGANGSGVTSTSKSSIDVFNDYNYYSYDSPSSSGPTPNPNNPSVLGDYSSSPSYNIFQSMVGGSGNIPGYDSSTHFTDGGSTAGDLAVGRSSSSNYRTQSGYNTDAEPRLEFVVDTSLVALGTLDISQTLTGTATFNVLAYNASGYAVTVLGTSLYNGSHYLTNLATDTASAAGTEQFGINLVANTSPSVGANPIQVPSSNFSYGVAGDGITSAYATPNLFRYNNGEVIASSNRDSGITDYTISFIANISGATNVTFNYSTELILIATGTF